MTEATKYIVDATITVVLEDVTINLDGAAAGELEFYHALSKKVDKQLVFLDSKGGRTGVGGVITALDCESIDNWNLVD